MCGPRQRVAAGAERPAQSGRSHEVHVIVGVAIARVPHVVKAGGDVVALHADGPLAPCTTAATFATLAHRNSTPGRRKQPRQCDCNAPRPTPSILARFDRPVKHGQLLSPVLSLSVQFSARLGGDRGISASAPVDSLQRRDAVAPPRFGILPSNTRDRGCQRTRRVHQKA